MSDEETARHMVTELTAARSQRVVSAWGIAAVHASLGDADPPAWCTGTGWIAFERSLAV